MIKTQETFVSPGKAHGEADGSPGWSAPTFGFRNLSETPLIAFQRRISVREGEWKLTRLLNTDKDNVYFQLKCVVRGVWREGEGITAVLCFRETDLRQSSDQRGQFWQSLSDVFKFRSTLW